MALPQSLIQSLEAERDQYLKDFGSNRFSFVREIAELDYGVSRLTCAQTTPLFLPL
jgi:hypothetical protein